MSLPGIAGVLDGLVLAGIAVCSGTSSVRELAHQRTTQLELADDFKNRHSQHPLPRPLDVDDQGFIGKIESTKLIRAVINIYSKMIVSR
jgi:hypothetical protein